MKLSQFKFRLPEELIALEPPHRAFKNEDGTVEKVYHRDECRLMVVHRKSQQIDMFAKDADGNDTDQPLLFRDIINYFEEGDCIVLNDTKVFPARLFGTKEKTDAQIEVFLLRELNQELRLWDVLVEPARKIPPAVAVRYAASTTVRTTNSSANCLPSARLRFPATLSTSARRRLTIWKTSRPSTPRTKAL